MPTHKCRVKNNHRNLFCDRLILITNPSAQFNHKTLVSALIWEICAKQTQMNRNLSTPSHPSSLM